METQTCTSHAVTLYFSQEDLNHRGLQLPLAPAEARQLVQSSLLTGGLAPWTAMEIDLFTYGTSLLLVARPAAETAAAFRFETLEDLIQAARLLPRAMPAVLLWSDDSFLLLPGILPEPLPRALYEFGTPAVYSAYEWAHLQEHGKMLMPGGAVSLLQQYFTD